jgi:phospholipid/cholesterol/gamma-HCH transport system permease protein
MPEKVTRQWVQDHASLLTRSSDAPLVLDFSDTRHLDSAGISFIRLLQRKTPSSVRLARMKDEVTATLEEYTTTGEAPAPSSSSKTAVAALHQAYTTVTDTAANALFIIEEILYWSTLGLLRKRDFRKGIFTEQMFLLGYKATGIVVLLSFLIGVVVSLQSALFLKEYGAGIFLASMIGWTMVREFGPLITAIIIAGRNGSATTAEIATMQVQEETDALRAMGLNPVQFIVVPKLYAIVFTMPLLSIIASTSGIFGGFLVSSFYLDIGSDLFLSELTKYIHIIDVLMNFVKSVVFAILIVWVGTFYGFKVHGGAEQVGKETTACVVTGIFVIIVADAFFSFLY